MIKDLPEYNFHPLYKPFLEANYEKYYMNNLDLEDLKKEVREIHLALEAGKFAYADNSETTARVANIGYYVERIARVLGISVNHDGSIRSIRQSVVVKEGSSIPSGWSIGQWARNNGGSSTGQTGGKADEERDGLAIEMRSNEFENDDFTGESNKIIQGGYALVENIPQMLHLIMLDLDRALGLQDAGANVLPSPNNDGYANYQGINSMLLDILYSIGQISRQTSGAHILSLKNQAMLQELMAGYGLPVLIKELEIATGDGQTGKLPYPGFSPESPTLNDLNALILTNLAAMIGARLSLPPEEEEEEGA